MTSALTPGVSADGLFFNIAHCDIAFGILEGTIQSHPCSKIVLDQRVARNDFQLPDPWAGHIDRAPLLFVSSNPSIGDDRHALLSSSREEIWNSHVRLFDSEIGLTKGGIYPTRQDGTIRATYVRHWAFVRRRAMELLQRDVHPGLDYAMTDIAHCKTHDEIGVADCAAFCADRFLRKIIDSSAARLIVAMGAYADRELRRVYDVSPGKKFVNLAGGRAIVFMPHSNFRGPRTFIAVVPEHLTELRAYAQSAPPIRVAPD